MSISETPTSFFCTCPERGAPGTQNSFMKRIFSFLFLCAGLAVLVSCGAAKKTSDVVVSKTQTTSLEGDKVIVAEMQLTGIEMAESLNDDGTEIIKRPFKWYVGIGETNDQQVSIELAQREAYATISRVFSNLVKDEAERGNVVTNKNVQQALTTHWEQFSASLQKSCEPFGKTTVQYNPATRLYKVTAKVAIRGDHFNQLLKTAGDFKPDGLTGEELQDFIATNKSIMEAARMK